MTARRYGVGRVWTLTVRGARRIAEGAEAWVGLEGEIGRPG
jgi:hypothetical protein